MIHQLTPLEIFASKVESMNTAEILYFRVFLQGIIHNQKYAIDI